MYTRNLLYLFCVAILFTTIYGLTKNEVLKLKSGQFYCKDDICVLITGRPDFDTIVFPNKEGKNTTYITDTCSPLDIDIGACTSKKCKSDSQCLSNKCIEGHCSFNEDNPIVHCQYVRTIHNDPMFGDPKGYRMQCGLPKGDKCTSNNDCSSYNCENYNNNSICGEPDDSGCHSACSIRTITAIPLIFLFTIICLVVLCGLCGVVSVCVKKIRLEKRYKKEFSAV